MRTAEAHGEGDARDGDEDAAEALSGRRRVEGGTGEAAGREPPDDPRLGRVGPAGSGRGGRGGALFAAASGGAQAGPVQGDHRREAVGVSEAVGAAAVRGGSRGGLRGRLQPREGLRPGGASAGAGGAAGPLRDASGLAGAGGLRRVPSAVGPPAGAPGGAGLLAADVDAVLSAPDDGRAVRRAGGRVWALRRRSAGAAVRPDAVGGDFGRPRRRRGAGGERGVPALRRPLGVPGTRLPAAPAPHEGQGGAADPPRAGELVLRSGVRRRLGSGRPGVALAGVRRQRPSARHDRRTSAGPLRAGRAGGAGAAGGPALRSARGGRGGAERAGQGVHRGAGGGGAAAR